MNSDVLVVGSLNADLVTRAARLPEDGETVHGVDYRQLAGGKGLNQAVAAARAGARTGMLGCVGDDGLGAFLLGEAQAAGVDPSAVVTVPGIATGVALIMVGADGTNRIIVVAGANGELDADLVRTHFRSAPTPAVVLCQLEIPVDGVAAALRLGRERGSVTVLNPAPAAHLPAELLADVDWLIPNEHEAELLLGSAHGYPVAEGIDSIEDGLRVARALRSRGPRAVAVTLGARGAVAVDAGGVEHVLAPFPVTAVDTTAAGDAFCGTFAAGLAAGLEPPVALRRACAAGALTATGHGAVPSIPTAQDVDHLLATRP